MVVAKGIEPLSRASETLILSVELRDQYFAKLKEKFKKGELIFITTDDE